MKMRAVCPSARENERMHGTARGRPGIRLEVHRSSPGPLRGLTEERGNPMVCAPKKAAAKKTATKKAPAKKAATKKAAKKK